MPPPIPFFKRAEIAADYEQGAPIKEISDTHSVVRTTVRKIAKEFDLPPRPKGPQTTGGYAVLGKVP